METCPLTPPETLWQTLPRRLVLLSLHCWRRTAVTEIAVNFLTFYSIFTHSLSLSLICCSSASISPSISPHLCLPLLCWSAYHLLWDGDLIGHLKLVSLIAGNCETRGSRRNSQSQCLYRCKGADRPNDQSEATRPLQWTSSSSWDQVSNVLLRRQCLYSHCSFFWFVESERQSISTLHTHNDNNRDLCCFSFITLKSWRMFHMRKDGCHSRETWDDLFSASRPAPTLSNHYSW